MTRARFVPAKAALSALLVLGLAALLPAPPSPASTCSPDVVQPSGAITRVCMPATGRWNGDLVVWPRLRVAGRAVGIRKTSSRSPTAPRCRGSSTPRFRLRHTSYRKNGLAILPGVDDVKERWPRSSRAGPARETYLVGPPRAGR